MNILVCVKQVPDDYAEIRLGGDGKPATAGAGTVNNAFDTYALELAVRFCEAHGGSVTAVTIGPEGAQSGLKNLLAVGAGKAYLCAASGEADEGGTAALLARAVELCQEREGAAYDLILCGKESTDEISGQVGARLAERLGAAFVSGVVEAEPSGDGLKARQETEEGGVVYEMSLPAVLTIAKPAYDPRYPNIKTKMAARKAVIPVLDLGAAEPALVSCLGYSEPPKREAGVVIQEKEAAEAVKKAVVMLAEANVL